MSAFDSYDSYTAKLGEGVDEKGKFTKYTHNYEHPCSCHPETCCHFDEKVWRSKEYKAYEDGSRVYL
jgi:hypothetical protein